MELIVQVSRGSVAHPIELNYFAFLKHLVAIGGRDPFSVAGWGRAVGALLYYRDYVNYNAFRRGAFGEPPAYRSNPTEKAAFTTIASTAISAFLASEIDQAEHSFVYEAAMEIAGFPVQGARPDLLCFTANQQFALEAKGRGNGRRSDEDLDRAKDQSLGGPFPVHFTVVSDVYGLYTHPRARYFDPKNPDARFLEEVRNEYLRAYYTALIGFVEDGPWAEAIYLDDHAEQGYVGTPLFPFSYLESAPSEFSDRILTLVVDVRVARNRGEYRTPERPQAYVTETAFVDRDGVGMILAGDEYWPKRRTGWRW